MDSYIWSSDLVSELQVLWSYLFIIFNLEIWYASVFPQHSLPVLILFLLFDLVYWWEFLFCFFLPWLIESSISNRWEGSLRFFRESHYGSFSSTSQVLTQRHVSILCSRGSCLKNRILQKLEDISYLGCKRWWLLPFSLLLCWWAEINDYVMSNPKVKPPSADPQLLTSTWLNWNQISSPWGNISRVDQNLGPYWLSTSRVTSNQLNDRFLIQILWGNKCLLSECGNLGLCYVAVGNLHR